MAMKNFYDYHVELEMPDGYKDQWGGVSLSQESALQVLAMADHIGANASEDLVARLRIWGNKYDRPKAELIRSREITIRAGVNTKRDYLRPIILQLFKTIA
jgi:hypothetical protein